MKLPAHTAVPFTSWLTIKLNNVQTIHVAVAVMINDKNEVLLSLRQQHQHQGGLWEFPGGKLEKGESVYEALCRESKEELDIVITSAQPLIKVAHDYADKSVLLDVWHVDKFQGTPQGQEGQTVRWCSIYDLQVEKFPAANAPIISAIHANYNCLADRLV